MTTDAFQYHMTSKVQEIAALAESIEAWSNEHRVPKKATHEINLMLDELLTNTIEHGYEGRDDGAVEITIEEAQRPDGLANLTITIRDWCKAFNVTENPEPDTTLSIEDRGIGGFGIHFVRKLSDSLAYRRDGGCNVVTVQKVVKPDPA